MPSLMPKSRAPAGHRHGDDPRGNTSRAIGEPGRGAAGRGRGGGARGQGGGAGAGGGGGRGGRALSLGAAGRDPAGRGAGVGGVRSLGHSPSPAFVLPRGSS